MTFDLMPLARRMIAIDSRSQRSNLELLAFLIPLCLEAGLQTSLQEEDRDGVKQFNLIASRGPLDGETLLLATHSDTVPPGDASLWTATGGDPFSLTEKDGALHGLGVADVKLDLLCKLLALDSLKGVTLGHNVALVATYGEETGRYGAKLLVKELTAAGVENLPRRIIVGEPTRLRLCAAHKGYLEFRTTAVDPAPRSAPDLPYWKLVFSGVAAHSSQPQHGTSANSACLAGLSYLGVGAAREGVAHGNATRRSATRGDAAGETARGQVALISVNGGEVINKVSARCEAVVAAAEPPDVARLLKSGVLATGADCLMTPVERPADGLWSPELADRLLALDELTQRLQRKSSRYQVPGFDPPYTTVNDGIVRLSGGHLSYAVDVRCVPGDAPATILDQHEAALRAMDGVSAPHAEGIRMQSERVLDSAPFVAKRDSELLAALETVLREKGLPVEREIKSGTTEAAVYSEAGMDAIIFGPGPASGNIHKPNEHVPVADLVAAIEIYRELVLLLCGSR